MAPSSTFRVEAQRRVGAAGADPLIVDAAGNSASSVAGGQGNDAMVARLNGCRLSPDPANRQGE